MVIVSSAFISSRRERIIFSVSSASGCAFKAAAWVDVLRAVFGDALETLGKTDLVNTDVARDHSFRCIADAESVTSAAHITHVGVKVSIFQRSGLYRTSKPLIQLPALQLPSWFRNPVE